MKNSVLAFTILLPFLLMAQKGIIKPDTKPNSATSNTLKKDNTTFPDDIKLWTLEGKLVNCLDSVTMCYIVKENGVRKTIPQDDLYEFIYEEGYSYTIWVKEELKTPPVSASSGIFNYIVIKIVSKKLIEKGTASASNSFSEIPVVSKNEKTTEPPTTEPTDINPTKSTLVNNDSGLKAELDLLKKQMRELKKQVDVMQLIIDMQMQLIQKK